MQYSRATQPSVEAFATEFILSRRRDARVALSLPSVIGKSLNNNASPRESAKRFRRRPLSRRENSRRAKTPNRRGDDNVSSRDERILRESNRFLSRGRRPSSGPVFDFIPNRRFLSREHHASRVTLVLGASTHLKVCRESLSCANTATRSEVRRARSRARATRTEC